MLTKQLQKIYNLKNKMPMGNRVRENFIERKKILLQPIIKL